ncbi:lipoprotein-releasing ABC transporter permease subunit [Salinisphaera sp. USBA-960]|uniref:lipoprotein-releasing ABC transporter permease subunit n=1 Tax=Salinisphaera orenii TaxID=856731 RepID=UPI000DBE8657|nr:lipoprotein-releasing ABC transporter permease subunit [Salifodinibacter halophilus]NNC25896.1 lipoprotein-releasing ABC transporter permease subunit [Salifodinibacter halophilus]
MFRPLELATGLRYTRARRRRTRFVSFISAISIGGIALAVMLLITVLSVMNGFESELRGKILGMASHVEITSASGPLQNWQKLRDKIDERYPQVTGAAPYIHGQGMVKNGRRIQGVRLRGVVPKRERDVSAVASNMVAGSLDSLQKGSYKMVIGSALAGQLNVGVGDHITLMVPKANVTPAGIVPRFRRFTVSGIFDVGMYQYDSGLIMVAMGDASALYHTGKGASGLRLRLKDMFDAPQVSQTLSSELAYRFRVTNWTQQHQSFFQAISTEKTMMFIILSLIIVVATFNMVSMLVMVVTDKQGDIAILRTLGLKPRSVMAIFMIQGVMLGVAGTIIGVILGVLLSVYMQDIIPALEALLHTRFLSPNVYYISQLKGQVEMAQVIMIAALSLGLSFISTLYPAWRAARVQPAEALRYE